MASLAALMLLFPNNALAALWRLNPEARVALSSMGPLGVALMALVAMACALSAIGLATLARWGRSLAIGVLTINLLGDLSSAFIRQDPRTLIGIPIGGAMIFYLLSRRIRNAFAPEQSMAE